MIGLLIAATLAGQSPVGQMTEVCHDVFESPTGRYYFTGDPSYDFGTPEHERLLNMKQRALWSAIDFKAASLKLDQQQTRIVCGAMLFERLQGIRDGISKVRVAEWVDTPGE